MDRPVKYERANYEELRDTTSLSQMCQGQIMKNCDGPWAVILANYLRQHKWFISEVIMNNDYSPTHTAIFFAKKGMNKSSDNRKKGASQEVLDGYPSSNNVFVQMAITLCVYKVLIKLV